MYKSIYECIGADRALWLYVSYGIQYWHSGIRILLGWCFFNIFGWKCIFHNPVLDHLDALF